MSKINDTFEKFSSNNQFKCSTEELQQIIKYLRSDLENPECKFIKSEVDFKNKLKDFTAKGSGGLKKYFSFLISNTEKQNIRLLKEIDLMFEKKTNTIKSLYQEDIVVVDEFVKYAKQKIKNREVFYHIASYEKSQWAGRQFANCMFRYLSYQIKTNPNRLTKNYLDDLKSYFVFVGLGLHDEQMAKKANHYFSESSDPFSFNIPEYYRDVRGEILMSVTIMIENQKLFERISDDVIKKYSN